MTICQKDLHFGLERYMRWVFICVHICTAWAAYRGLYRYDLSHTVKSSEDGGLSVAFLTLSDMQ